mmetsp:Transcript_38328/g.96422  ORF Transcript_38328/g.96422 Transcript_38328/m.96422 type:complete len:157 (-) Transcript_38328:1395-1865(-)
MSVCSAKKETAVHACVLHASLHEGGLRVCVRASVFVGTSSSSAKPTHSISLPPPLLSQTVDLVCKDLDKYHHALDKALVKYHTLKMDEINKIVKELWQATYKGHDIETIAIQSSVDAGEKKKLARSYSYRVCLAVSRTARVWNTHTHTHTRSVIRG